MPRRRKLHLLIIDHSMLAQNMYDFLFSGAHQGSYHLNFIDSISKLKKLRIHEQPDVLILNSNAIERDEVLHRGKIPTLLLCSADRTDLKESYAEAKGMILVDKPFYPYDLLLLINHLVQNHTKKTSKVKKAKRTTRRDKR